MARDGRGGGAGGGVAGGEGWRQWLAGLEDSLAGALELPRDAVRNLPRITLLGGLELVVENHRGVLFFAPGRVLVAVPGGRLEVTGRELAIGRIDREQLRLQGQVEQLRFLPVSGGGEESGRAGPRRTGGFSGRGASRPGGKAR
ncbi:hypothetical protein DYI95_010830 [Thermaerobacter sp. PB12/4term]|uniref:YabP/YqfC family sporulation protein n=1 Tax=Thermaerobacter sp. PB12/4term TaxID=2293838 RepID=UPI000E3267E3|nr:YabP/YqfC family sporulation protein [Thermaerobacter sp. PB12/4term]QIA27938.1 hypothetical protein DYI95_010830 [Thermaerobacter sp. PB12/4term]